MAKSPITPTGCWIRTVSTTERNWRIAIVTAVWRRHEITRAFWQFVEHLRGWWPEVDLSVSVAGSSDDVHRRMAEGAGAAYIDAPNIMGLKFNLALKGARAFDPDAILVLGSDDLFTERVADAYRPFFAAEMPYVGLKDFYFLNTVDGRAAYWPGYYHTYRDGEPAGGGRLIPRRVLDACDWALWHPLARHSMDRHAFQKMASVGCAQADLITVKETGGVALSLKGPDSLWSYDRIGHRPCTENILAQFPLDIRQTVMGLRVMMVT